MFVHYSAPHAFAELRVTLGYLEKKSELPPVLSNLEIIPDDEGLAGAIAGLRDVQTTGKFLDHEFVLETDVVGIDEGLVEAANKMLLKTSIILIKASNDEILKVSNLPQARDAILINVSEGDNSLRSERCRNNLLHTIPSRAMLADALAQFSYKKRWTKWALIEGDHESDRAFTFALEGAAKKFQLKIVARKTWAFNADMRRNAAQEVPLFTQDFPDYDLLVISDERHDFGRYILYNTWVPRPVAGSEGLVANAWSAAVEQYGAAQLQSRFNDKHNRSMRPVDYAAGLPSE